MFDGLQPHALEAAAGRIASHIRSSNTDDSLAHGRQPAECSSRSARR
jgi:hypothetical protein